MSASATRESHCRNNPNLNTTMNKTLYVSLLAAALMGGQVLADEFYVSDYTESAEPLTLTVWNGDIVHVNTDTPIYSLEFKNDEIATILYETPSPLVYQHSVEISRGASCNIKATQGIAQTWLEELRQAHGMVPLFTYSDSGSVEGFAVDQLPTFFGASPGDSLTITGTELSATVIFKGLVASALGLEKNEIGYIITTSNYNFDSAQELSLVSGSQGLETYPVSPLPEAATATFSLLALACLAAYRKRR